MENEKMTETRKTNRKSYMWSIEYLIANDVHDPEGRFSYLIFLNTISWKIQHIY